MMPKDPILFELARQRHRESHLGSRNFNYGKHLSEETKKRISIGNTGKVRTSAVKEKISNAKKGENHQNYGKPLSEKTKQRISAANAGRKHTDLSRKHMSAAHKGKMCKENHPGWKGGISFEPYCVKFDEDFKERVRMYYGHVCVGCGTPQDKYKLHVHHVNFDKLTCCNESLPLFVILCRSCHTKTNNHRGYWEKYYTDMINNYYSGKCYFTKSEMGAYSCT